VDVICSLCRYGEGHCFGKGEVYTVGQAKTKCECHCVPHTFPEGDVRYDMIAILTAEAHSDYPMLKAYIASLDDERAKASLLLMTKYAMWMVREAGLDPIQMVQDSAVYWQGGGDDDNDEEEDEGNDDQDDIGNPHNN
jgi:hypothetical protein